MNRVRSEGRTGDIQRLQAPRAVNANTDRARSLNPMIYPSWWGDEEAAAVTEQPQTRRRSKQGELAGVGKNTF